MSKNENLEKINKHYHKIIDYLEKNESEEKLAFAAVLIIFTKASSSMGFLEMEGLKDILMAIIDAMIKHFNFDKNKVEELFNIKYAEVSKNGNNETIH